MWGRNKKGNKEGICGDATKKERGGMRKYEETKREKARCNVKRQGGRTRTLGTETDIPSKWFGQTYSSSFWLYSLLHREHFRHFTFSAGRVMLCGWSAMHGAAMKKKLRWKKV